jgi:glycosyltransferase involved in cell wall biosynthesis
MRILIFSELLYPHGGGAELATWLYSKLLAEKGFKITIVTSKFPNEPSYELLNNGIEIFRLPMKIMFGTRYYTLANIGVLASSFVSKLIKQSDIIYIPCGWYSVIPIAKIYRKPVVVHMHNYSIVCPTSLMYDFARHEVGSSSLKSFIIHEIVEKQRKAVSVAVSSLMNEFLGKYYNRLGSLADALIFVSRAQANLIFSKAPHLKVKSHVIYNPIPELPFIKAESKGVGYFGGRRFVKGFNVLMQTLKSIRCGNVMAYLTMISEKYHTAKVGNGVIINFLPRVNSLKDVINKIACVVIPSIWPEPSPYVLIESMLYGKLIVASNVGGIPEIVTGVHHGVRLVKAGDYKEITDALNSFLALELKEVNEIALENRKFILQKFKNEETVKLFTSVLEKVL